MKKLILFLAACAVISSCKKDNTDNSPNPATCTDGIQNQGETGIDCGGICTPCPTCSDGIQNQGETGIDCGGPCTACSNFICDGNASNPYYPLAKNNVWHYDWVNASTDIDARVSDSATFAGNKFYHVVDYFSSSSFDNGSRYLRVDASQNIKLYYTSSSTEYLYIPSAPTLNQSWPFPDLIGGAGTRKVMDLNASISVPACSYTGCLKIQDFMASGSASTIYYYKKGLGMVYKSDGSTPYKLMSATIN